MENENLNKFTGNPLFIRERHSDRKEETVWSLQRVNDYFKGKEFIRAIRKGRRLKQDIFTFGCLRRIPELMKWHNERYGKDEEFLLLESEGDSQRYILDVASLKKLALLSHFYMCGFRGEQPSAMFIPICTEEEKGAAFELCLHDYFYHYEEREKKKEKPIDWTAMEQKREKKRDMMRKAIEGEEPIVGQVFKSYLGYELVVKQEGDDILIVSVGVDTNELGGKKSYRVSMSWNTIPFIIDCFEPSTREEFTKRFGEATSQILDLVTPIIKQL